MEHLKSLFFKYDIDNDGIITSSEFKRVVNAVGVKFQPDLIQDKSYTFEDVSLFIANNSSVKIKINELELSTTERTFLEPFIKQKRDISFQEIKAIVSKALKNHQ